MYTTLVPRGCMGWSLFLLVLQSSDISARYEPIPYNDFVISILNPIYGSEGYPSTDALHSHRLAVFFMVLANGNLYDESHPDAAAVAEQYYALARAAFSLDSILLEVTCATVQALFLVFCFVYNSSQSDKEERWLLTGITTRIAQTVWFPNLHLFMCVLLFVLAFCSSLGSVRPLSFSG